MISSPSGNFKRTKHFMARIGFLVDHFVKHLVRFIHVISRDQIADILTKPLGPSQFLYLRNKMMGRPASGDINLPDAIFTDQMPIVSSDIQYKEQSSSADSVI